MEKELFYVKADATLGFTEDQIDFLWSAMNQIAIDEIQKREKFLKELENNFRE